MPITTQERVTALAHCPDPYCPGSEQAEVDAVKTHTDVLYVDVGGTIPGTDHSHDYFAFADEGEGPCEHCGLMREVTDQRRPRYRNESGQDPLALLKRQNEVAGKVVALEHEREVERLNREIEQRDRDAELASMRAELAELKEALSGKANKSGPKPKGDG